MNDIDNQGIPSGEEIDRIAGIVANVLKEERPRLPATIWEHRFKSFEKRCFRYLLVLACVMIPISLLAIYSKSEQLAIVVFVLSLVVALLSSVGILVGIISTLPFFLQLRQSPYGPYIALVKLSAEHDLRFVDELSRCSKQALQYMVIQCRQERNGYERRAGMLAGAIEKVGIFPALAGLVLLIFNLMKVPGLAWGWGAFFGPLLLAFYALSFASAQMTHQMDRVLALLEFSLQSKE